MSDGGVLLAIWRSIKTLFWLTPTSPGESRELRERIEEEKRAKQARESD